MTATPHISLSALVVTFDEERRLAACLRSLAFCDELVVADLGSTDASVAIATQHGANVHVLERAPFVEAVWPRAVPLTRHEWVVILDPDEAMPEGAGEAIRRHIADTPDAGMISLPMTYYVGDHELRGTRWGLRLPKSFVFRRSAVDFVEVIHAGRRLRKGFRHVVLDEATAGVVKHHWVDSMQQLLEKHRRYLPREGEALYRRGARFTLGGAAFQLARQACRDLVHPRAYRDGVLGVGLGLFSVAYEAACLNELRRYQLQVEERERERERDSSRG